MSEIKTVLNFFDKNNGLDAIIKDLKKVQELQAEINNQKGGVSSDNLKERTAALKKIVQLQKQLDKERKKAINTGKQAVGIQKDLVKVQEQERRVGKQLKVARTEKFRQLQETNLALRNQKKLVKAEIIENSKLSSVYERQSAKLNRLRKELKNLILTEGEGSAKTKKLALEVGNLDRKLKGADAAAGQFQRNVGNYPKGLSKAVGALKNFAGALGITAGIAGVVAALKGAFSTFKDFEKSLSNLSSITGATGKDLEFYKEQAIAIGSSTTLSASQTVEAFKLIGSAKPELLANKEALAAVTREAITLAEAAGLELPTAAKSLTNALNQFNLPAEEAGRVINILAAGSKFGAAAIPEISEALTKFGVAAKSANITVEESVGAIELLAEKGIEGAEAGTKLRNVFGTLDIAKALPPKAAKELAKFGVNLDIVTDSSLTLEERLTELGKIQDDAVALTRVFGKENKIAGQSVLQNIGRIAELTEQVTGTNTAIEQANINVDNLDGSLKGLSSAYEGLILSIESGDGALGKAVRSFVDIITQLFLLISGSKQAEEELTDLQLAAKKTAQSIVKVGKVLTIVVSTFLAYKAAVIASNIATKAYTLVTTGLRIAKIAMARSTNIATAAMKAFNIVTKLSPIGLILGLITAVAGAFLLFRDNQDEATESTIRFTEAEKEALRVSRQRLESLKTTRAIYAKLIKDENAGLRGFTDAQLEAAKAETIRVAARTKSIEILKLQQKIIKRIEEEQLRREKEFNKLSGKTAKDKAKADKKAAEEAEKKRLAEIENQRKRLKILDDIEIRAIEDATEKKKALRSQAFEEKIDQLERSGVITAEIEKKLTQELQDDLTQIELDAELERQAILKSENDKLMAELEKQAAEEIALAKKTKAEEAKIAEEALALRKEQQQEAIDLSKELVDTTIENLTMESEAKIEALDRQLSAEQDFLSQNENLSAREIEFRRKKAAELELQRIEEQKRLEKLAKVQAFFDLVAAFASSGDGQGAVGKAATTMAAAEVISEGFHDGGYTGDGNEYKEAGVVHKGEFVNTKAQTTEYGMKGWESKDFDKAVNDGYFNQFADANIFADQNAKFLSVQSNEIGYDFARLENELKSVKEAIHNSPTTDFEINGEYFIKRTHRKGSTTTKKRKLG